MECHDISTSRLLQTSPIAKLLVNIEEKILMSDTLRIQCRLFFAILIEALASR